MITGEFLPGDIVRLKSGSLCLVIETIDPDRRRATVRWQEEGAIRGASVDLCCLVKDESLPRCALCKAVSYGDSRLYDPEKPEGLRGL